MSVEPSDVAICAWARLMRAQQIALSQIEKGLKNAGHPPLVWYDVLLELDRGPVEGMRPFELEQRMLMPQYGLSRLLDRLGGAGLVTRRPCALDGRGQIVLITEEGRMLRRRVWPAYASAIQTAVGSRLTDQEATQLSELLGKLSG